MDLYYMIIDTIKDLMYTLFAAAIGVMLKWIELFILQPSEPEGVWSVQYELFLAAFGILWAAHLTAPDDRVRWVFEPMVLVGGGLLFSFALMILASPVEGLPPPAGWSFARNYAGWFTIIIPDAISVFVLLWSIVVARRVQLQG
jgi:hypothetical protein